VSRLLNSDITAGYLPAEHIETPTERLARPNKHRNIDLTATMLSDIVQEKCRGPLGRAMRRRNAKTVRFADPMYYEACTYENNSEEERGEGFEGVGEDDGNIEVCDDANEAEGSGKKAAGPTERNSGGGGREARPTVSDISPSGSGARVAEAAVKRESEEGVKLRPNLAPPAIRHPGSAICCDENTGTKKLTLTPNHVHDNDIVAAPPKPEVIKGQVPLDRAVRLQPNRADDVISPPATWIGKGSVLGNLFKKRNKKGRRDDEVEGWLAQAASGSGSSQEKQSIHSSRSASQGSPIGRGEETKEREETRVRGEQRRQQERQRRQPTAERGQLDMPMLGAPPLETNYQPQSYQPYWRRMSEDKPGHSPQRYQSAQQGYGQERDRAVERLSESPEQITFHDAAERADLLVDTSAGNKSDDTLSHRSTPEVIDRFPTFDTATTSAGTGPKSHHRTLARTGSDWSLRTYLEDDNDLREMLIAVQQDKGDGAQQQHPQIAPQFAESSQRLEDITKVRPIPLSVLMSDADDSQRLDGMLRE